MANNIVSLSAPIFGAPDAARVATAIDKLLDRYRDRIPAPRRQARFSAEDVVLITYGDMVRNAAEAPLRTLARFTAEQLSGVVNSVHLLPFYPYSSDDGFSVIDYYAVDPKLGDWGDVAAVGRGFRLMFDAVINHISAESDWFSAFKQGVSPYDKYFVTLDPATDLSAVFRPRTSPLLTPVETATGRQYVWTTFSSDQIDLNYANPDVLLQILDVVLTYVARGAELIRLDAIAFMWKEPGTRCLHQPQTHALIQLLRAVLDQIAPHVVLITETNVPHAENISYFGDGTNEAQMVYNFSLPPLTLHAFHTGDATTLTSWAANLRVPSERVTFFNFLASHDGIGVTPARGFLSPLEIATMARRVEANGGFVSYRTSEDGQQVAYELNCNYLDALGDPAVAEPVALVAKRFIAAQAIMLAMPGVPGIYFHSLFGSQNWPEGVAETGRFRTINRQKVEYEAITAELATAGTLRQRVFDGLRRLIIRRCEQPAFDPRGTGDALSLDPHVFAMLRRSPDDAQRLLCLHNVSNQELSLTVSTQVVGGWQATVTDIASNESITPGPDELTVALSPYQVRWLQLT